MSMRVPITEVARQYCSRELAHINAACLPFAIQRFFQGRQLFICLPNDQPSADALVLLWAFAWDDASDFIPARYSLLSTSSPIAVCNRCWAKSKELFPHEFFARDQAFFNRVASTLKENNAQLPMLVNLDDLQVQEQPQPTILLNKNGTGLWVWRGQALNQTLACDRPHDLHFLAVLELQSGDWHETSIRQTVASIIDQAVTACVNILSGNRPDHDHSYVQVVKKLTPPVRLSQDERGGATHGPPEAEGAAVQRLVDHCRRIANCNSDEFDPLAVVVIRRCGEASQHLGALARARFVFSDEQKNSIQESIAGNWQKMARDVVEIAEELNW